MSRDRKVFIIHSTPRVSLLVGFPIPPPGIEVDYVLSSRSDKQDDELACTYRLKNNFAYITNQVKRLGFPATGKKNDMEASRFFPWTILGLDSSRFFCSSLFFCCLAPTRDCVVTHINVAGKMLCGRRLALCVYVC